MQTRQMSCSNAFEDYLVDCPENIQVNILSPIGPYSSLLWVIKDKFGKEYSGSVTTDGSGAFQIPVEDLPAGLLNHHGGTFTLKILDEDNECQPVSFLIAKYYEEIRFEVRPGPRIKNNLGCELL